MSELYQFCAENGNYGNKIINLAAPNTFCPKNLVKLNALQNSTQTEQIKSSNISNERA